MTTRETPKFIGVTTYSDPLGRFSFRYPMDWHQFELADEREGVMVSPIAEDPQTYFSVWISQLEYPVVAEDYDELLSAFDEGLQQLDACQVLESFNDVMSNLIKFERLYTFRDGDVVRKRRVWVMYVDKWLYVVTLQGENEAEYAYWLAMANHSFYSFTLPHELWFATDRELRDKIVRPDDQSGQAPTN